LFPFVDCSLVLISVFFQEKFIFLSKKECSGEIHTIYSIHWCVHGLFRDFHAWLRVYMHSGFGNFIKKQVLLRVVALIPFYWLFIINGLRSKVSHATAVVCSFWHF
jgi:hypothetical protein